jgi:hypothetical protein
MRSSAARGDQAHAKEAIQRVLKIAPDHLPSIYQQDHRFQSGPRSYAAAEDACGSDRPGTQRQNARQVLAAIYLRGGRRRRRSGLEPALRRAPDDPRLLRTAAEAYLASSDAAKATEYSKGERSTRATLPGKWSSHRSDSQPAIRARAQGSGRDIQTDTSSNVADLRS